MDILTRKCPLCNQSFNPNRNNMHGTSSGISLKYDHREFSPWKDKPANKNDANGRMTSSNRKISALLALCVGNSPVTGEFPAQRPVTWASMFSLVYAWINGWVNNRDLRRHCAHYDVIVMGCRSSLLLLNIVCDITKAVCMFLLCDPWGGQVNSKYPWWLLMAWRLFGARTFTTMLIM